MPTTLSFSVPTTIAARTKKIAKKRGFKGVSEYIRFLLNEDKLPLISADELAKRAKETEKLYAQGKLIYARSLKEFLK